MQAAFEVDEKDNLGLMVRGGLEYGLGVYITGVDLHSVAYENGLCVRTPFNSLYIFLHIVVSTLSVLLQGGVVVCFFNNMIAGEALI